MIYTPEWELLADALERVVSVHGDLLSCKAAICNAVADEKIAVRVTIAKSHHRHPGAIFKGRNVGVPARLNPDDFDWPQSRPLQPWGIGPRPGENYTWISGWEREPINLIELRRVDVTTVLRCEERGDSTKTISYAEAVQMVGKAKFGEQWVRELTGHEEFVFEAGAFGGPSVAEFSDVRDKVKEMEFQHNWAEDWFERSVLVDGSYRQFGSEDLLLPLANFAKAFAKSFPDAARRSNSMPKPISESELNSERSSAKAESNCRKWLTGLAQQSPEKSPDRTKDKLFAIAKQKFPGLSERAFGRAWDQVTAELPVDWRSAGRRRKSSHAVE
jgi:hypothetical protein